MDFEINPNAPAASESASERSSIGLFEARVQHFLCEIVDPQTIFQSSSLEALTPMLLTYLAGAKILKSSKANVSFCFGWPNPPDLGIFTPQARGTRICFCTRNEGPVNKTQPKSQEGRLEVSRRGQLTCKVA